jgi:hypothetical protein
MDEEFYGGPGPEDVLNASAALAQALRLYASQEAQAASGLRASLGEPGGVSDIRRARAVAEAVGGAASRAALLLEAAEIVGHGGEATIVARALAEAIKRAGLPPNALSPDLRAAALCLPTDDASARIAASIRVSELLAAL